MEKINGKQIKNSRISNKRQCNEKFDNSLDESKSQKSSKATFINSKKSKKSKLLDPSTSNTITSVSDNNKVNDYIIGDIVWAKTGKYPIWPGIVINDPESNIYYKNGNNFSLLHICYFNYANKRNWLRTNQIFEFNGKDNILKKFPKLIAYLSRRRYKHKWNIAVDEAQYLTMMDRDDRLNAYFSNDILNYTALKNKAQDDKSSNELSINDQQPATIENQPSNICVAQTNTEVYDGDFNQNVDHETQFCNYKIEYTKEHPMILIPEFCNLFYLDGLVTGGGVSIKLGNCIYIAPSEVKRERLKPEDLFVQDIHGVDIKMPSPERNLSKSQCTPIFMCSYTMRGAGAVIHINSLEVKQLCLLNPGKDIRIQDLAIIKAIYNEEKQKYYDIDEEVIIPIIENSKYEKDLVDMFKTVLKTYPMTSAVLVRDHGMYIWGKDWWSAKSQCKCYDYAFKIMIFKKINGL